MTETLQALAEARIVPVLAMEDPVDARPLADALVAAGLPIVEVTFRTERAAEVISAMRQRSDLVVGAGTVLSPEQVDQAVGAGARFVVSPGLSRAVVERCAEQGVPALPGVATATEIQAALELGITTVKYFPAGILGGPKGIAALGAVFGGVKFVPTGGIGPGNLREYLATPSVLAVGGSWMVVRELIRDRDFAAVQRLAAEAVALAHGN